jgi:molybdopterin molybdotransferase
LVRLRGFKKLTPIEEAMRLFFEKLEMKRLEAVEVSLKDALNRVAAESITSPKDLPPFNRSAVDGYAVKAKDTFEASQFAPKTLKIVQGNITGGNQAVKVWTGNPLPEGADAVIMLEYTRKMDDENIEVWKPVAPWENVSKKGEDMRAGETVLKTGTRLRPHHLGLLAALGFTAVEVFRKPKVAVLATGNELVEPGVTPTSEQVIEVNRLIISSLCQQLECEPLDLGIAKDDLDEIASKIYEGLEKADMVVTTGGTSVGAKDLVPEAVNQLGEPGVVVHGIAMRPAMPTALGIIRNKPVIVLSGNPVAAMIGFEVFAKPLIQKMLQIPTPEFYALKAKLTRKASGALGRRSFLRVYAYMEGGEFYASPIRVMGSSIISTMSRANGYVIIPEDRGGLEKGEMVTVYLFDYLGGKRNV